MNNTDLEDLLDSSPSGSNNSGENSDDWLTSLADLFEGEVPDLDTTTWSEEEIIDYSQENAGNDAVNQQKKDKNTASEAEDDDFADLLLFEPRGSSSQANSGKAGNWQGVESYIEDDGDNFLWDDEIDEEIDEGSALNTQSNSVEQNSHLLELSAPTDSSGQLLSEMDFEDMFALGGEGEQHQKQPEASSPSQLDDLTNLFDEVPSEFLEEPEEPMAELERQSLEADKEDYAEASSEGLEFDEGMEEELLDDRSLDLGEPELAAIDSYSLGEQASKEIDSEYSDLLAITAAEPQEKKNIDIDIEELDSSELASLEEGLEIWDWELETAEDETDLPTENLIESADEDLEDIFDGEEPLTFAEEEPGAEASENEFFAEEASLDSEDDFASLFEEEPELERQSDQPENTDKEYELAREEDSEEFWLNFDETDDEEERETNKTPDLLAGLDSLFDDSPSEEANEESEPLDFSDSVINELQQEVKQPRREWDSRDADFAAIENWELSGEEGAENFEESWFMPEESFEEESPLAEIVGESQEEISFLDDEFEQSELPSSIEKESENYSEEIFEELGESELPEERVGVPFAELDALLGSSNPLRQPDRLSEIDFAPLEALLEEPAQVNGVDFAALETLLAQPATIDFAALEAVLNSEPHARGETEQNKAGAEMEPVPFDAADEELSHSNTELPFEGRTPGRSLIMPPASTPFMEQTMKVPVRQLDNLNNLVGELVVNRNSLEQDQERMRQFLDNLLHQVQNLADVGQRMQDLYERVLLEMALLSSRQGSHFLSGNSEHDQMSVFDMDRFTPFHTLAQEILELIVRVRESSSDIEFLVDETEQVTRQLRQITTQLQEGLTRSRMVPFSDIADRLRRGVRDNAINFGKQVELTLEGRETLVDKMILEKLHDPLNHLVNNALAHGVELPQVREGKGKDTTGNIVVRAFHQGNQTVISVSDDGAGIDAQKVKIKAIEKGLITPAEAKTMSRLDVYDLLFEAGFSTRDRADQLAGRGVGMDVVRRRVSEIRGVVNVDSTLGKGTSFTIRLPLALSISKALVCISDRVRIAFPMDGVEDMLDVPRDKVQIDSSAEESQQFIPWRDTMLPFRSLRDLLRYNRHLGRGNMYGGNTDEEIVSVVVLRSAGNYLALQVDQVLGEQEIVIKQLEGPVAKPMGIAGATVMGDGRIVAIADVLEMIDIAAGRIRREVASIDTSIEIEAVVQEQPTVLIVDDSITVRELLSMTFNKAGYRVEQARDGQEAWEKLRAGLPCDIVFCDIEMPRMDGLQLLSQMQKDPHLQDLPIAMLTSRGADKHRQMAVQMGANGYFTKPYLEEALLEAASRMLKGENLVLA